MAFIDLQLPVFEAFTNNTTSLKNRVMTYADSSLLYLPVVKLNSTLGPTATGTSAPLGGYYVSVDQTTTTTILSASTSAASSGGYRLAQAGSTSAQSRLIFDQGLDTQNLSLGYLAGGDAQQQSLYESAYLVEIDSRLLGLTTPSDLSVAQPSFIDDDNVATYYFALGTDAPYFARQNEGRGGSAEPSFEIVHGGGGGDRTQNSMIGPTNTTGRLGSRLVFGLRSSLNLQNSQDLFTRLGGTATVTVGATDLSFSFINTVIRITGFNTGYRVEVPLKLLKYTS